MATTFKARFTNGVLKPLGEVNLREGEEFQVTLNPELPPGVLSVPSGQPGVGFERSFGGWAGLVDCDELKRMLYEARELGSRHNFDSPQR